MEAGLGDWEQSKENVIPLKSGRRLSALQASSGEGTRDHLAQEKRAFEVELRLYKGDDELDVWYRYVLWIEQHFPRGGQEGNLPGLLKQCINRFKNDVKYKNDERYVQCWLKFARYSPTVQELFMQMDALEIGHKSAAFYEAWSWHLEQLGNFRKASQILQEGIDNNAQPLEVLLESQRQFSRKFVKHYTDNCRERDEQRSDARCVLGSLKPIGSRKNSAPVSRGVTSNLPSLSLHPMSQEQRLPSQNSRFTVLQDAENILPSRPKTFPISGPSDTLDSENEKKPKPWSNVKMKCPTTKMCFAPTKPEFTVHEDGNSKFDYGRKFINSFTTVFRGSCSEIQLGFSEPDEPNQIYVCNLQKIYGGGEEFQPEEIAAAHWYRDQKKKQEEKELIQMKEELQRLRLLTGTINQPVLQHASKDDDLKKQSLPTRREIFQERNKDFENKHPPMNEVPSPRTDVSSPTRDVIALWNGTLNLPNPDDNNSNASEKMTHTLPKPVLKTEHVKQGFQVYSDEQENNNHLMCAAGRPMQITGTKQAFQIYWEEGNKVSEEPKVMGNSVKLQKEAPKTNVNVEEDGKENNAPAGHVQNFNERASPHNILQPTDRPIHFGIEEEDCIDDDLGVHPLPEEECHTIGPLTSQLHFAMGAKLVSTPLSRNLFSEPTNCSVQDLQYSKPDARTFKTPSVSTKAALSPITEASKELSKSSSACTTTSSSSSSSLACSTRRFTTSAKSLLYNNCIDPYDSEIMSSLLLSASLDIRMGYLSVNGNAPKLHKGQILNYGKHKLTVLSQLATGGEGKVFKAETSGDSNWPYEVAVKVYKPTNLWEFYLCSEVHKRIRSVPDIPDIRQSLPLVLQMPVFNNCNFVISEYCSNGTLLDFVNSYRKEMQTIPEILVMYFAWEILQIVSQLHSCQFVHGDIKPDNFVLLPLPKDFDMLNFSKTCCLRLIDFGRSIDRSVFPKGTMFNGCAKTENFICPEMQENKPWIFQPDYFGILGTIHIMLFPEYMEVRKVNDKWMIKNKFKRYWQMGFWDRLFDTLLNVPDCDAFPDLRVFVNELQGMLQKSVSNVEDVKKKLQHFCKV